MPILPRKQPKKAAHQRQSVHLDQSNLHRYKSPEWQRVRTAVLSDPDHAVCRMCQVAPSTDVDHIVPINQGGSFLSRDNLQGLCRRCHLSKTGSDGRAVQMQRARDKASDRWHRNE